MIDLAEYEHIGDLHLPFEVTKKQQRTQPQQEKLRPAPCTTPGLTWEAYRAGEPCPGCGRPYIDDERWESKGTTYFTEEERAKYDAEEDRYKALHGDCHAHRHSVNGALTTHCGKCCPPPPLSSGQIRDISRLLGRRTPDHELMRWRLRLYCGHVVERRSHYSHKTVHSAFLGRSTCPECGLDPSSIIDAEPLGLAGEPPRPVSVSPQKPTRAQLEAKVRELEAQVAELQGKE